MNSTTPTVHILIVDHEALFRQSVSRLLSEQPDFEVVADCGTAREALEIISATDIDLVLLDSGLGQQSSLDFIAEANAAGFRAKVLIVTSGLSKEEAAEWMRQGGDGIFLKESSADALTLGIRQVMSGKVCIEKHYLRAILDTTDNHKYNNCELSERECRILTFLLDGLTNRKIGELLNTSEGSVKSSIQQLFKKFEVRTRSQLVRIAVERNDVLGIRRGHVVKRQSGQT